MGSDKKFRDLITIYCPSRNYGRFLSKAVTSVINQSHQNWELFIIDENSEDDTAKIAEAYEKTFFPKIRFIKNETPIGVQKIANQVLRQASGSYIMRLDADDWLSPYALHALSHCANESENCGAVTGDYILVDESGITIAEGQSQKMRSDFAGMDRAPHGACSLFNVRALKSVGGYYEEVDAQDGYDIFIKLKDKFEIKHVEYPVFFYRQHSTSLSSDAARLRRARETIVSHSTRCNGDYGLRVLAVVGAKSRYAGEVPVPLQLVGGKPLVSQVVEEINKATLISDCFISCDSSEIAELVSNLVLDKKYKKNMMISKRRFVSGDMDGVPINAILRDALSQYSERYGFYPDVVLFVSIHRLLNDTEIYDHAIRLLASQNFDSVVTVESINRPILTAESNGLRVVNPGRFDGLNLAQELVYRYNDGVVCAWSDVVISNELLTKKIGHIECDNRSVRRVGGGSA